MLVPVHTCLDGKAVGEAARCCALTPLGGTDFVRRLELRVAQGHVVVEEGEGGRRVRNETFLLETYSAQASAWMQRRCGAVSRMRACQPSRRPSAVTALGEWFVGLSVQVLLPASRVRVLMLISSVQVRGRGAAVAASTHALRSSIRDHVHLMNKL